MNGLESKAKVMIERMNQMEYYNNRFEMLNKDIMDLNIKRRLK